MKEKTGFINLAKKSLAVLATSLGAFMQGQSKGLPPALGLEDGNKNINYENFQKRILKSKLVLKLNSRNPEKSFAAMHQSHSSHSSHSSHASHYSSSPSYPTPSPTTPNSTTSPTTPSNPPNTPPPSTKTPDSKQLTYYSLGIRFLFKGCEGTDVEEVQQMLLKLGYNVLVTGYYGDLTVAVVTKFQQDHSLAVDGKVGSETLKILKAQ